jgi:hypothetical protein
LQFGDTAGAAVPVQWCLHARAVDAGSDDRAIKKGRGFHRAPNFRGENFRRYQ